MPMPLGVARTVPGRERRGRARRSGRRAIDAVAACTIAGASRRLLRGTGAARGRPPRRRPRTALAVPGLAHGPGCRSRAVVVRPAAARRSGRRPV